MKVYWINKFKQGFLGMMPKPNGDSELQYEIQNLKEQKVDCLICLIEKTEMQELGLMQEEEFCKEKNIEFIHFPIKDFHLPEENAYFTLLEAIQERLQKNQKVVIHCRAGIGRTGTVAAGVLLKNEIHTKDVFEYLSKVRTCQVPDTEEQRDWVLGLDI